MNNLETFGPKLTKVSKVNPYRVPDGYFDSLPSRIQTFCKEQGVNKQPVNWVVTIKAQLALAAGICFFVFLSITGYYYSKRSGNLNLFERTDYIKIVEDSGTEFDEVLLFETATNSVKKDVVKKPMNDELMEYLLNTNIENGTLLEQPKDIKP
jgi:hypothetical protein